MLVGEIKIFWIKKIRKLLFKNKSTENIFNFIYAKNLWKNTESVSGPGSTKNSTKLTSVHIKSIISTYTINSVLDCGCGDFNWMKDVDMENVRYTGIDIVTNIVSENKKQFSNTNRNFFKLNICTEMPPMVDLVICRDVLVHLTEGLIKKALQNLIVSGSKYFLFTTFPDAQNSDTYTGSWRKINLQVSPYNFPAPLQLFSEDNNEQSELFKSGKRIGLWSLNQLQEVINVQ